MCLLFALSSFVQRIVHDILLTVRLMATERLETLFARLFCWGLYTGKGRFDGGKLTKLDRSNVFPYIVEGLLRVGRSLK